MGSVDQIVQVQISQQTQAVQQASFSIPAIFGPADRFEPESTTATTVSGSKVVVVASASGLAKGQLFQGTGIPSFTNNESIVGTSVTKSQAATASASGVAVTSRDVIRAYTSLAGMISDGFLTSDGEYIRAAELLEQALQPTIFYVGLNFASVKQVVTVTPNVSTQSVQHFIQTIDGVAYDFTSDSSPTASEVVAGLVALINADSDAPVAATGTTTLVMTSKQYGDGFSYSESSNLTAVLTVANHSIADDVAAAQNMSGGDNWYGLTICSQNYWDIEQVAAYIETIIKIFIADSNDADIITSSTTDVASVLKGLSYTRTGIIYAGVPNDGRAAAWLGGQLPQVPGASTWKFKTLVGITPDVLTATQRTLCIGLPGIPGKNCNIYETVGGVGITEEGFMSGGAFIDVTVGIDWLVSQIQTNVFSQLVNSPKIPYTDAGVAVIENGIRQALQQGVSNGLIDGASPITVEAPLVLDIPVNDRANRLLPDVTFSCRLAGAFHFIQITGTVTV